MALTRKFLKGMGLSDEQTEGIIDAHAETVDALKSQIETLKADSEKAEELKKELDTLKSGKDWKAEYETLKKSFDDYKAEIDGRETLSAKKGAYKKLLNESGIPEKYHERILKLTDFDKIELEGDTVKDADKQRENINNEWGEFKATVTTQGAKVDVPPQAGKAVKTKAEILAIKDTAERQQAIAENHEIFGF